MLGERILEIIISFWLLIVAVQYLYRSPLLADSSTDYWFVYVVMAVITSIGLVKAVMEYRNGNQEDAPEASPCTDGEKTAGRSRRSRR